MKRQSKLVVGPKPDDPRVIRLGTYVNKGKVYPYASKRQIGRAASRRLNKEKL